MRGPDEGNKWLTVRYPRVMRAIQYNTTQNLHFVPWSEVWPTNSLILLDEWIIERSRKKRHGASGRVERYTKKYLEWSELVVLNCNTKPRLP